MKAFEQHVPVVLSIMPYKVVLTFESVDETLKCDHSHESHIGATEHPVQDACIYYENKKIMRKKVKLYPRGKVPPIKEPRAH